MGQHKTLLAPQEECSSQQQRPALGQQPLAKIQPPAHLRRIAQWLCRFPSEILLYYPMLEDIPIDRLLLLTASLPNNDKLDRCITSRKEYQLLFPSIEELANLRDTYFFLHELHIIKGFDRNTAYSTPLDRTARELAACKPPNLRALQVYLADAIQRILTDRRDLYHDFPKHIVNLEKLILRDRHRAYHWQLTDTQRTDLGHFSISRHKNAFEWPGSMYTPSQSQQVANSTPILRHEQLSSMADLIEEYPEILKKASDPHPEPRPNWKHTVKYLRNLASKSNRDERQFGTWPYQKPDACPAFFRSHVFPLVPSDKSLTIFVIGVTKLLPFLPTWFAGIMDPSIRNDHTYYPSHAVSSLRLFRSNFAELCFRVDKSLYPYSVLKDIETAVVGMALVHTLPDTSTGSLPVVLRTKWTPWSAEPYRTSLKASPLEQKPLFVSPPLPHLDALPSEKLDKRCIRFYMPTVRDLHSPREFEWLEAFCSTVRFFERMEHGRNLGYENALEQQRQIDLRIRMAYELRHQQKSEGEDANALVGGQN